MRFDTRTVVFSAYLSIGLLTAKRPVSHARFQSSTCFVVFQPTNQHDAISKVPSASQLSFCSHFLCILRTLTAYSNFLVRKPCRLFANPPRFAQLWTRPGRSSTSDLIISARSLMATGGVHAVSPPSWEWYSSEVASLSTSLTGGRKLIVKPFSFCVSHCLVVASTLKSISLFDCFRAIKKKAGEKYREITCAQVEPRAVIWNSCELGFCSTCARAWHLICGKSCSRFLSRMCPTIHAANYPREIA